MKKHKFIPYSILITFIFIVTIFAGCAEKKNADKDVVTVRLNEVTRSVFYAPMYAAMSQGFFAEEGLKVDLTTGEGADTTIFKTQVL